MSEYEQKAEIYGVIALATENLIDAKNLERSGQGDVAEMHRNQSLDMMAELDEVYRKADAHDSALDRYRLLLSIFDELSPGEMMDKMAEMNRKSEAYDNIARFHNNPRNYVTRYSEFTGEERRVLLANRFGLYTSGLVKRYNKEEE